jgi:hypothetical protein
MKKVLCIFSIAALILAGCAPSAEEKGAKEKAKADSISFQIEKEKVTQTDSVASSGYSEETNAPAQEGKDKKANKNNERPGSVQQSKPQQAWDSAYVKRNSDRKLIKTANLVFSVANVERTTCKIEYLSTVYGGFILSSGIKATTSQLVTQRINKDTILEIGIKNIENTIVLRVPQFFLDTVLYEFSKLWTDLDERTTSAQDVTIDFMANELRARMYQKTASNINQAAQTNQKKLDDVVNAEAKAAEYLETTIQKKIDNLTLQDKIDYATITLRMYQDNILYKKKSVSYEMDQYEPAFGNEFVDSLAFGWNIILGFILFLAKAWSVLLIMFCLFLVIYLPIKYSIKKRKLKSGKRNE